MFKRILLALVLLLVAAGIYNYPKLNIIAGYASKNIASTVFISHRDFNSIVTNDNDVPLVKLAEAHMLSDGADASVFGLMKRKTVCREGLGCVLINSTYDADKALPSPHRNRSDNGLPFPFGNHGVQDTLFENVDYEKIKTAIDGAFENNGLQKTRTVLVAYKNNILMERYAEGFSKDTPILGWSMTKSVLATLYGILQYQEQLNVNDYAPIEFWQGDERHKITIDHLLRMQSGLAWDEDYASISDVTRMLFLDTDMTKAQARKKAIAAPTEIWNYSSGTTNLLSGILRSRFDPLQDYLDFPYTALIDRIGMYSMLIEADMAGNYVGSSYGWATTRDWAKFGLLYLNEGSWNGDQLFHPSWVDYVAKPTAHSDGTYGAHFWLNANGKYPNVPKDLYSANGFQGQYVFIIPSKDLVVVRTGLAEAPDFNVDKFLKEVIAAID